MLRKMLLAVVAGTGALCCGTTARAAEAPAVSVGTHATESTAAPNLIGLDRFLAAQDAPADEVRGWGRSGGTYWGPQRTSWGGYYGWGSHRGRPWRGGYGGWGHGGRRW